MNKFSFFSFFFLVLLVCSLTANGQNNDLPHATINLVRTGNYFGSACRSDITFPNQREFNLSLGSIVKYKIYSEGDIAITINQSCPASQYSPATSRSAQINVNVKRGNEYYVLYNGGNFNEAQKADVEKYLNKIKNVMKQEENLDFPINKSSLRGIASKSGEGQGTCFLVSDAGYFVTNYHVIENAKEITVKGIDGDFSTKYGVTIVSTDPSNDLALLKISNKNVKFKIPYAIRSTNIQQGEKIYAMGYPLTFALGDEIKLTDGIISAKSGVQGDISKFQISAAVQPGNSGGPLIDDEGNVIGVIYAKSTIADATNYAIKASYLETFLKNVEGFDYPVYSNSLKTKPLTAKVAELKNNIFIVETK
ncbi:S1C family serine protease [Adhaeribacter soli]|uniref:Trypsin-like peptidase domain-containing protein n=1 Tax=Adhaeribacter soli TaxID=2607655 RepID=A0A5N1IXL7_9BACT|nr:serine protease [Adhaeribacter soli]KAA9338838.1 trypsin-like peptidase domain-containing protein [Adhaeribacter soli]